MGVEEIIKSAEKAKPIGEMNGVKIASFEDATALATLDQQNKVGLNPPSMNPDGSLASLPTRYAAVNVDMYFDNRYRKVEVDGETQYQVVIGFKDYLAVKNQATGRCPHKQVVCDIIVADKEGKPAHKGVVTVSDTEFVSDFTDRFSVDDMTKIMPLLLEGQKAETSKSIFK